AGLEGLVGLPQDAAVGAHGEPGADGLGRLARTDRDHDDLGGLTLLLEPERLLDGDLVERVHRHLDVRELYPAAVAPDANFDVVVDDPLYGHQDFHGIRSRVDKPRRSRTPGKRGGNVMAGALPVNGARAVLRRGPPSWGRSAPPCPGPDGHTRTASRPAASLAETARRRRP